MKSFLIDQSDKNIFTSNSGLLLVGHCINDLCSLPIKAKKSFPVGADGIGTDDILRSYLGLLSIGQSDFEAVSNRREDEYFREALNIDRVPSAETLRQRLDAIAPDLRPLADACSVEFLKKAQVTITPLRTGHIPLHCSVFGMDNSKTKKEGISPIHNGQEGYAVMAAYLGTEGWCLELELVKGSQHCREGFIPFLLRAIEKARALTSQLLLLPLDSAHDVRDIRLALRGQKHVSYVINWNPRREDKLEWAERVFKEGKIITQRPGKRVGLLDVHTRHGLNPYEFRHIVRAVECTIDHLGHLLLVPENDIEGWCTNLGLPTKRVIGVYENHGKSEQFNREIKSDLDMERLPSGKLATNALVLTLGGLAYNVLRAIGQFGLFEAQTPVRHPAKRYQIKTVIQELMYLTARLVRTGRRLKLVFSRHCPAFEAFRTIYTRLASEQSSKGD